MRFKLHARCIIIVLLILGAIISLVPFPTSVNVTYSGVQWKVGNNDYSETVEITAKGTYYRYLFKENKFKGHIYLSNYPKTAAENSELYEITFPESPFGGTMRYITSGGKIEIFGNIYVEGNFQKILIHAWGADEEGSAGLFIAAPALNRQSANELAEEVAEIYDGTYLLTDTSY